MTGFPLGSFLGAVPFTLLADEDHKICEDYGVWAEKSMYGKKYMGVERTTFIIDKGGKVVLRPGTDRDVYDRMLDGRTATIERLYVDYEDGAHIAVTIDDDPGQELFRETGRYLFFKAGELETVAE